MQVSLSVRLAIGLTAAQVDSGMDKMLMDFLEARGTTDAVARMYAPSAVFDWLRRPELVSLKKV